MWTCMKCGEQVEESFEICWSCCTSRDGAEDTGFDPEKDGIVSRRDFETQRQSRLDESLVQIASFPAPQLAHMLKDHLEDNNIPACVTDEEAVITNWLLQGPMGGIKVLVLEKDAARARLLAANFDRDQETARQPKSENIKSDDYGLEFPGRDDQRWRRS